MTSNNEIIRKHLDDGISLLREVATSKALSEEESVDVVRIADSFTDRLNNIKLKLGIIGEFNAGKSTLINSIIGQKVSATGDRPCTPVPIYIENGDHNSMDVFFSDGTHIQTGLEEYQKYTTDSEETQRIKSISVKVNSTFLKDNNVILVDTPGINAINPDHTQITINALDEMHAAILLMYSKQPGSKSTIEFLKQVSNQVEKIFVCISKSDFLNQNQISRIVSELPERLGKASGVKIDNVWPIHITENDVGDDFLSFMAHLKDFMMREWYNIISKDLKKALSDCANRVSAIVNNRLLLQERLFYSYLETKPTNFSHIMKRITNDVIPYIEEELNRDEFELEAKTKFGEIRGMLHRQIEYDLKPDKPTLGIFERKADPRSIQRATKNVNRLFRRLTILQHRVLEKAEKVKTKLENSTESALSPINGSMDKLEKKLYEDLRDNPKVIAEYKKFLSQREAQNEAIKQSYEANKIKLKKIITVFCVACVILIPLIGLEYFYLPLSIFFLASVIASKMLLKKEDPFPLDINIYTFVKNTSSSLKNIHIPKFSIQNVAPATKERLQSANNFFIQHERGYSQVAGQAMNIAQMAGGFGMAAGVAVAFEATRYLKSPTAQSVADELNKDSLKSIELTEKSIFNSFDNLKDAFQTTVTEYTQSIYDRYKIVLDSAFDENKTLLSSLEKAVNELSDYSHRLQGFLVN